MQAQCKQLADSLCSLLQHSVSASELQRLHALASLVLGVLQGSVHLQQLMCVDMELKRANALQAAVQRTSHDRP